MISLNIALNVDLCKTIHYITPSYQTLWWTSCLWLVDIQHHPSTQVYCVLCRHVRATVVLYRGLYCLLLSQTLLTNVLASLFHLHMPRISVRSPQNMIALLSLLFVKDFLLICNQVIMVKIKSFYAKIKPHSGLSFGMTNRHKTNTHHRKVPWLKMDKLMSTSTTARCSTVLLHTGRSLRNSRKTIARVSAWNSIPVYLKILWNKYIATVWWSQVFKFCEWPRFVHVYQTLMPAKHETPSVSSVPSEKFLHWGNVCSCEHKYFELAGL